ncbi:TIGR04255 family protein [Flavobacterium columnare]|uniref:TIGR04255 family protein n=1 Tax=Flavobacterium columnare TaxID=996 RepID=UPI0013D8339E|nr:TIGR04255 family protein [Flavobacterium columnare]
MKIPKSIEPDRIKDAIIEVNFESELPNEVNLGMFFSVLKNDYKYSNKPIGTKQLTSNSMNFDKEITLSLGGISLFYNDKIKFQINNNSIAFNCLEKYLLWDNYSNEIKKVLNLVSSTGTIKKIKRVGVRYISEYSQIDLKDNTNFSFTFGFPNVVSNNYSFSTEFDLKDFRVVLNLSNKIPIVINNVIVPTSVIDIDVVKNNLDINEFNNLFEIINLAHDLEKEVFFQILKEDFLVKLNPQY